LIRTIQYSDVSVQVSENISLKSENKNMRLLVLQSSKVLKLTTEGLTPET
jgi:hypothetical protein